MKRTTVCVGILAGLIALAGCLPEKRVRWSPDGRWATVKGGDGLYLCDQSGKLSERLATDVGSVAWLPDSKSIVLSRSEKLPSWTAAVEVLPADRRLEIEARAPRLRDEILAHEGEWDGFKPQSVGGLTGGESLALFVLVREQHGAGLAEKLGDKWDELKELQPIVHLLQQVEVKAGGTFELGPVLAKALDAFDELRVAPNGRAVAYRGAAPGEDPAKPLFVLPLHGQQVPQLVADRVSMFPDWSPDSRHLVYAAGQTPAEGESNDLRLGIVARRLVCTEDGALLADFPEAEELAGIAFQNEVRVRCLRDGRVLFATLEVSLPCTSEDMPQRAGLFAVEPGRQPGVTRLIPRQTEAELPDVLFLFEVSPDEQHVTVPGGNGGVAVLTLATGDVWQILGENEADHLRMEPAWRSADELCFAFVPGPKEAKERPAIALVKLDWAGRKAERRIISGDWPEPVVTDFLIDKRSGGPASE